MSRRPDRVPTAWFDELYSCDPDPWGFATSGYEARKYDLTVAALPRPRYRSAFEPGCSFGELTARLAPRCDQLLAADAVAEVVERARARFSRSGAPQVRVERRELPGDWPPGPFDLVVLSELGYYFPGHELDALLDDAAASLEPGGDLVAVHWLGETSYPLAGADVARHIDGHAAFERCVTHLEDRFELGVWSRR